MNPMNDWPVTHARRFETYVRWSLYALMLVLPFPALGMLAGATSSTRILTWAIGCLVLAVIAGGFNILAAKWSFDRVMGRHSPIRTWFLIGWFLATLGCTAAYLAFTWGIPGNAMLIAFPIGCAVAAIGPALTARQTGIVSIVAVIMGVLIAMLVHPAALTAMVMIVVLVWIAWSSGWMLRVLLQLQQAHETRAQLTLAEERLRISRDLHDVFGRTLATISVKSELAAELTRRGHHDRAADEMAQIRQIANTAGAEVRRVVRGERRATWSDEVEGAKALLSSAGIRCVIAGEDVPEEYAETLAWVIREGVTNVLRHSRASQVSITTSVEDDEVALTVSNDGASWTGPAEGSTGTGLESMAARLHQIGGVLEHQRDGDWFVLTASIPVSQEVSA